MTGPDAAAPDEHEPDQPDGTGRDGREHEGVERLHPVHAATVGDGRFLFDPSRVRAHGLNPSAALVWDHVDGQDRAGVVRAVAATIGVSEAEIDHDVRAVLDQFVHEGLVSDPATAEGATGPTGPAPGTFANVPHTDEMAPPSMQAIDCPYAGGPYTGLGVRWRFETTDGELAAFLQAALAPLRSDEPDAATVASPTRRYRVIGARHDSPDAGLIALDGFVVNRTGVGGDPAGFLLWHMNQLVSTGSQHLLLVHASAVVDPRTDGAVVFPASMNSGKSTLVAGLVRDGFRYVTDETVGLDPATLLVHPYPKAIGLDPGSWPLLPEFTPAERDRFVALSPGKWFSPISTVGAGPAARRPRPVVALLFPRFDADGTTSCAPVEALDAALALAHNCFNLAAVGQAGVDAIATVAGSVPAARLTMADLPDAVAAVRAWLDHLAATAPATTPVADPPR